MKPERFLFFALLAVLPRKLFCLSPLVRTGIFKIVKKHPKIRSCAQKILPKDEYNSGRVHELTGECEGLKGNLSNNKADDEGYAYVKKILSKRVFLTPLEYGTPLTLTFPDLENGKRRLEVVTDLNSVEISVLLSDEPFTFHNGAITWTSARSLFDLQISPADNEGFKLVVYQPEQVCHQTFDVSGKKTRIAFSFPTNSSIQVSLDNTGLCTFHSLVSTQGLGHLYVSFGNLYSVTDNYDYD